MTKPKVSAEVLAREFVKDRQKTQAAIRAGYKPSYAYAFCTKIFDRPDVKAEIERLYRNSIEKNALT